MHKVTYFITAFILFSIPAIFGMTAGLNQELAIKKTLVQQFIPIARLAPRLKLNLLLALVPLLQEQQINQYVAQHSKNGIPVNQNEIKNLVIALQQHVAQEKAPASTTPHIQDTQQKAGRMQERVNQARAFAVQNLRPEEQVGLVLYLAQSIPTEKLQTYAVSNDIKSTIAQLSQQAATLKGAIQNRHAAHLQAEIAKHEQQLATQVEPDTP